MGTVEEILKKFGLCFACKQCETENLVSHQNKSSFYRCRRCGHEASIPPKVKLVEILGTEVFSNFTPKDKNFESRIEREGASMAQFSTPSLLQLDRKEFASYWKLIASLLVGMLVVVEILGYWSGQPFLKPRFLVAILVALGGFGMAILMSYLFARATSVQVSDDGNYILVKTMLTENIFSRKRFFRVSPGTLKGYRVWYLDIRGDDRIRIGPFVKGIDKVRSILD